MGQVTFSECHDKAAKLRDVSTPKPAQVSGIFYQNKIDLHVAKDNLMRRNSDKIEKSLQSFVVLW